MPLSRRNRKKEGVTMKRLLIHTMFAAATLVAVAGCASAQNLKAEIPFAFRAGTVLLQPGTYDVAVQSGVASTMLRFYNRDTRQSAVLVRRSTRDAPKAWIAGGRPMLGFRCAGANCAVSELWTGGISSSVFAAPKSPSGDPVRVAEVRLTSLKAD
jgi:hypothetical protein